MFFFLSTEMLFKAITKQSPLWDRLFWRSSCGRSTTSANRTRPGWKHQLAAYLFYPCRYLTDFEKCPPMMTGTSLMKMKTRSCKTPQCVRSSNWLHGYQPDSQLVFCSTLRESTMSFCLPLTAHSLCWRCTKIQITKTQSHHGS
jgi:hypothetical protein